MGLFDLFTGAPAKQAAAQTRSYLDQTQQTGLGNLATGYGAATGAVNQGAQGALGALGNSYGSAINFANDGIGSAINSIGSGTQGAMGVLGGARTNALGAYDPLSALGQKYGQGTNLYLDSLGVNGAGGNQRATDAFHTAPGYNFNLDQGLDAINRRRAAGGMLNSGNADRDAQTFGAGLADQAYSGWQQNLGGLVNPELAATQGAASGRAGIEQGYGAAGANLLNQQGQNVANLESTRAGMLSDLASRYGSNVAGVQTGQGNTLAGLATGNAGAQVGLATGLAQPYANTYNTEANAQMQGSKNLWDLGTNALALGTGQYGRAVGGTPGGTATSPLMSAYNWLNPPPPQSIFAGKAGIG